MPCRLFFGSRTTQQFHGAREIVPSSGHLAALRCKVAECLMTWQNNQTTLYSTLTKQLPELG